MRALFDGRIFGRVLIASNFLESSETELIGNGFQISSGKCSEFLQEKTVVRALAA